MDHKLNMSQFCDRTAKQIDDVLGNVNNRATLKPKEVIFLVCLVLDFFSAGRIESPVLHPFQKGWKN